MKTCVRCKSEKELTEYSKSPRYRDGHSSWCKQCHNDYTTSRYVRTPHVKLSLEELKRRRKERNKLRYQCPKRKQQQKDRYLIMMEDPVYRAKQRDRAKRWHAKNRDLAKKDNNQLDLFNDTGKI